MRFLLHNTMKLNYENKTLMGKYTNEVCWTSKGNICKLKKEIKNAYF